MTCLSDDLWERAKELTAEGRHLDARLMESAAGYLEQFRDETVPEYAGLLNRLVPAGVVTLARMRKRVELVGKSLREIGRETGIGHPQSVKHWLSRLDDMIPIPPSA